MKMTVLEYLQQDGKSPYPQWFDQLPAQAAAKVATAKVRMELGNIPAIKWFDGIGEYRIHWGPGLRIYLARDGENIILLLGGGDKSTQSYRPGKRALVRLSGQKNKPALMQV